MNSYPTTVQKSVLSGDALAKSVLKHYSLKAPVCEYWCRGLNDTYIVRASRSRFMLRIYRAGWRTRSQIAAELDLLTYLHRRKVPVARPIRRKDGRYLQGIAAPEGRRYAALFSYAPGQFAMDRKKAYRYGQLAATIHANTDHQSKRYNRFHLDLRHLLDEPLTNAGPFLDHRSADLDFLRRVSKALAAKIRDILPTSAPEYDVCHGDLHHGNVHFDDDDEMTIFDFDCWGYGWRAYDIAVFYWNYYLDQKNERKREAIWREYRRGYRTVRQISRAELKAVTYFVPIRHIWLIGLHTGLAKDYGRSWLHDGYFDHQITFIKDWMKQRCPDLVESL